MCVLATNKVSPRRFLFLFPLNGSLIELLLNYLEVKHLDEVDQSKSARFAREASCSLSRAATEAQGPGGLAASGALDTL